MPRIIKPAKGSFTVSSITVDSSGRVVAASSGVAGGNNMVLKDTATGPASGTFTANSSATKIVAYVGAGGGNGGSGDSDNNGVAGGAGGQGGFGVFSYPITAPYSVPFSVGAAGGATSIGSPVDASATAGGSGGPRNAGGNAGQAGNAGAAPGAKVSYSAPTVTAPMSTFMSFNFSDSNFVLGGNGGPLGGPGAAPPGKPGFLQIYEDLGS